MERYALKDFTVIYTQYKGLSALIVSVSMLRTKMDISLLKQFILQRLYSICLLGGFL